MLRSRVSSTIDTVRLSTAVSRPGIDPRIWVSYAVLTSEPYIESTAGQQDVVVDLQLMPTGEEETARVGAVYAGNGFGFYTPLHINDEVLVCAPSGDPDEGLVVMQRLWSPADPPPQEVYDNPQDVTLVVEPGKNLRLNVKGAGNVVIAAENGKVFLGEGTGTEAAAKGVSLKAYLDSLQLAIQSHTHVVAGATGSTPPIPITGTAAPSATVFPSPSTAILANKVEVK